MRRLGFSKGSAAWARFDETMGKTAFLATAVQLPLLGRITLKRVCWRNRCSLGALGLQSKLVVYRTEPFLRFGVK